jgi:hypothetical protein
VTSKPSPTLQSVHLILTFFSLSGLLAKRQPALISADINLLTMFFQTLSTEDQRVKPAIQEGLTMMCRAFESATHLHEAIQDLLLENIDKVKKFLGNFLFV